MAETANISEISTRVSNDIFKYLKWNTCKPKDENWICVNEVHDKKTHPSDVVFNYEDPYSGLKRYVNTDLKSYSASSINKSKISSAIRSLAMSVECANISSDWQEKFIIDHDNYGDVVGMLFIFNHDNEYDRDFKKLVDSIGFSEMKIQESIQIVIIGPDIIERLINTVMDIKTLIAEEKLPKIKDYTFYYPDLVRARRNGDEWNKSATIESITSPWLIIKHKKTEEVDQGFIIYYHQDGETIDEFIFLLDAISHYQMLSGDYIIRVRLTSPSDDAINNFERAKKSYLKIWGEDISREKQMNLIEVTSIINFSKVYSPTIIGMERNG